MLETAVQEFMKILSIAPDRPGTLAFRPQL
jgi:hypothetical protein